MYPLRQNWTFLNKSEDRYQQAAIKAERKGFRVGTHEFFEQMRREMGKPTLSGK